MKISNRKDVWHHSVIKWALIFLGIGLSINIIISLWEGSDIGFFSANTVFTSISTLVFCTGLVANLSKDFNFFMLFGLLACFNFLYCIQPIVMWTDEGNLCNGLSEAEQQIGRDCYTAAVGAVSDDTSTSFDNLISLVTSCYSNNNILTSASGVCYNIRWGQSNGNALRAFMLISWLCLFFATIMSIVCAIIEIVSFGQLHCKHHELIYRMEESLALLLKDSPNGKDCKEKLNKVCREINPIEQGIS